MVSQAIISAGSAFLLAAVVLPLERRYRAWKTSRGEITLRRDAWGRLVPDLRVKRMERAVLCAVAALIVVGLGFCWSLMGAHR